MLFLLKIALNSETKVLNSRYYIKFIMKFNRLILLSLILLIITSFFVYGYKEVNIPPSKSLVNFSNISSYETDPIFSNWVLNYTPSNGSTNISGLVPYTGATNNIT